MFDGTGAWHQALDKGSMGNSEIVVIIQNAGLRRKV